MINQKVVEILRAIADILEIQEVQFKPIAYRRAAESIESLPEDLEQIYKKQGIKGLEAIPNIGIHIALKIEEIIKTGKLDYYNKLKKQTPIDIESLREVQGLGPKKIKLLYQKLKIKNIKDLKKAAEAGKLKSLPKFKEKTQENILEGIKFAQSTSRKRFLLGYVWHDVIDLINQLKQNKYIQNIEPAGSFRRRRETIGDLDILVTSQNPKEVINYFTKLNVISRVLAKGETKSTVILKNNMQVDLRVLKKENFGAAMQYFIGNKEHNIELRKIAISHGYKLSEYSLSNIKNKEIISSQDQKDIYKKLGLDFIEPELRENHGEIALAKKHKLPKLLELKDIKSDMHMHTIYSDGADTTEEMIKKCISLKYDFIAITDHLGKLKIANAMNKVRFEKQSKEINILRKKYNNIKILHGAEIDIKENGKFDLENSFLKEIDFVVAGLHSGLHQDKARITKRVLDTLENENIDMISHPSARLINERNTNVDVQKIIEKAKETKTILEINSQPQRLDLNDINIREAIKQKVNLRINTDAHSVDSLDFMKFGVFQARRGWSEKQNILNTLNYKQFIRKLR